MPMQDFIRFDIRFDKTHHQSLRNLKHLSGAIYLEFILAASFLLCFLLGAIQLLLIYIAFLEVEQATFEAARTGSVNNGDKVAMLQSLSDHLIELYAPGKSATSIASALQRSRLDLRLQSSFNVRHNTIEILNPTKEAFDDWNTAPAGEPRRISNFWQATPSPIIGPTSGVSQQDANLLKIQTTYAFELKVPLVNRIICRTLMALQPMNTPYYLINRIPMTTTAVIQMQTDPIENSNLSLERFKD